MSSTSSSVSGRGSKPNSPPMVWRAFCTIAGRSSFLTPQSLTLMSSTPQDFCIRLRATRKSSGALLGCPVMASASFMYLLTQSVRKALKYASLSAISPAPWGSSGQKALIACSMECSEVQLEVDSTIPASMLARATLVRALRFPPLATASGRYFASRRTASRA